MSIAPTDELAALSLHEPYGCTYLCGETFPSTLEWRQHELRAHRQAEMWRCNIATDQDDNGEGGEGGGEGEGEGEGGSGECGASFYTSASLATHLTAVHAVPAEGEDRAAWVEHGHIYPEGQVNFWCGFCRRIVPLEGMGTAAWAERLDHLQLHFQNGDSLAKGWLKLKN